MKVSILTILSFFFFLCFRGAVASAGSADPLETHLAEVDIPEEVLQISIFETTQSSLDGHSQTAAERSIEQGRLRIKPENVPARLSPKVLETLELLRLRKLIKSVFPFFPFF